uniref:DNA-repair protein Xrcc1 N-terminal domain-containing protein n=1 Tax=Strigamia maritima TaxID=126957 RepID=T1IYL1_STRMM
MAPINLAFVVNFTSQDDNFPAENLLYGMRRWQNAPNVKVATTEVEIQFANKQKISHIDVGNYGSANLRIQVGRSSWPRDREFVTFLPTVHLMSPSECRQNINRLTVRMFGEEHFDEKIRSEMWDRVRILCHQPYRPDVPFGLSFIKFHSLAEGGNSNGVDDVQNRVEEEQLSLFERLRATSVKKEPEQQVYSRSARLVLMNSPASTSSMQNLDRSREIGNSNALPSSETSITPHRTLKTTRKRSSSPDNNKSKKQNTKDDENSPNDLSCDQPGPSATLAAKEISLKDSHEDSVLCPVCSEPIARSFIDYHVNLCLDFGM